MHATRLVYDAMRSIDSATFTGVYQKLGSALSHATSIVKIVNNSNVLVTVSTDGINDQDILPANSFFLYDITSDSPPETGSVFVENGRQYFVKGSAGVGLVYLVTQYVTQV